MSIKDQKFINGNPPMVGDDFLNTVKNEINNLISYFLDLDPSDKEQQMQAILVANLGGLNVKPLNESTGTDYKVIFNSFKKTTFPKGFSFFEGMTIWLNNTISNTGPAVITILDKGPYSILDRNGEPLEIGELQKGLQKLVYKNSFKAFYLDAEDLEKNTLPPDFISGFSLTPFDFSQDQEVKDFIIPKNLTKIEAANFLIKKIVNQKWEENVDYNNTNLVDFYEDNFSAMANNDDGINKAFASTQLNSDCPPFVAFDKVTDILNNYHVYATTHNLNNQAIGRNNPNLLPIGGFKFVGRPRFQNEISTIVEVLVTEDNVASGVDNNILNNYNWVSKGRFDLNYNLDGIATVMFKKEIVTKNIIFKLIDKIGLAGAFSISEIFILTKTQIPPNIIPKGGLVIEPPYKYFNELSAMTSEYSSVITLPQQIAFGTSQYDSNRPIWKAFVLEVTAIESCWLGSNNTSQQMIGRNNPLQKEVKGLRIFRGVRDNGVATKIEIFATNDIVRSGINPKLETDYNWTSLGQFETGFTIAVKNGYIDFIFDNPNNYNNYAVKVLERVGLNLFDYICEIHLLRKNYCDYIDVDFQPPMTSNTTPAPFITAASNQLSATYGAYKAFSKNSRIANTYWRAPDNITGQGICRNNIYMDKINYIEISRKQVTESYATKIEVFGSNYIFGNTIVSDLFTNENYKNISLGQYETKFIGEGYEKVKIDISQFSSYRQYLFRVIERVGNYDIIEDIRFYGEKCRLDGNYSNWNPIQGYLFNVNKGGEISIFDQAIDINPEGSNILKNQDILKANYSQLSASGYIANFLFDTELNLINENFKIMYKNYWVEGGKAQSNDNITEIVISSKTLKTDSPLVSFSDDIEGNMNNDEISENILAYSKPMTSINTPIPLRAISNGAYDVNTGPYRVRDFSSTTAFLSNINNFPVIILINNPSLFDIYGIQLGGLNNELNRSPIKFDILGSNDNFNNILVGVDGASTWDSFDNIKADVIMSLDKQTWLTVGEVKNYMFDSKNRYKWYGIKVYSSGDNQYVRVAQLNLLTKANPKDTLLYRFAIKNLDNDKVNFGVDTNIKASNLMNNSNVSTLGYTKFRYIGGMRYNINVNFKDSYDSAIKIDSGGIGITNEFYQQFFKDIGYRRITPDYSRGVAVPASANYIVPYNGVFTGSLFVPNQSTYNFFINDIRVVTIADYSLGGASQQLFIPVKKGDKYRGEQKVTFYPFYFE